MNLPDGINPGDVVSAKRAGWDERLSAEQEFDLEPYAEHGYATSDLRGRLEVAGGVCLVGGQEADPATVRR